MRRRQFVRLGFAGSMLAVAPALMAATQTAATSRKFIWVMLRGALDSLHAVVPTFDRDLEPRRESLLNPLRDKLLALHQGYALHPALGSVHQWYREGSFMPVVAVASPYRSRSHFDAQDVLESGLMPMRYDNGWLARALSAYHGEGIAIARSTPMTLRGSSATRTWFPSDLPNADTDLYQRLLQLYENDALLHQRLQEGMATRASIEVADDKDRRPRFQHLTRACGELLAENANTHCAMLELSGWDTHAGQAPRLATKLQELDEGLKALRVALGDQWGNTLIAIGTEFGRTVAVNGTSGTDHGTASALLFGGGALKGGRVLGEWPGLSDRALHEGRDLRPTSDIRGWLGAALAQHWSLDATQMEKVFPGVTIERTRLT